jgi:hypothetical protein
MFLRPTLFTAAIVTTLALASCSAPPVAPTETALPPTTTPAAATLPPEPTATATDVPAPARASYTMNVVLDYSAKSVSVDEAIVYPNHSGQLLSDLVLAVEPNLWEGCFTLNGLSLDGEAMSNFSLNGQKLSVPLTNAIEPEKTITLQLQYTLALPEIEPTNPDLSRPRIFGYSARQINLTNWYPFIVPWIGGEWVLHDPWYYGEHLVYDAADYTVNIKSADPAVVPVVAASGAPTQNGEWTTYSLTAGRTFAISASTEFLTASTQVGDVTVTSYYLQQIFQHPAEAVLSVASQAIQVFSQRYGPYPHKTLSVVMGDFNDGMEFSAFFFMPHDFYNLYDGTPSNGLTYLTAHETSHQWWFEQVANDQAMEPWLDEALATYSEHVYYETVDPQALSYWWTYRYNCYNPEGWVDAPIYGTGGNPQYWSSVYCRGRKFLDDLRGRIGDDAFFGFLQDYLRQENGKIATASDFFRILREHATIDYTDIIRQYFQNVQ